MYGVDAIRSWVITITEKKTVKNIRKMMWCDVTELYNSDFYEQIIHHLFCVENRENKTRAFQNIVTLLIRLWI